MRLIDRVHASVTAQVDPRAVGIVRAVIGAAALAKGITFAPVLLRLLDPTRLSVPLAEWLPQPSFAGVGLLVGLWLGSAIAFMIGWRTRWAGLILAAALASVLALDAQLYANHLYLLAVLCALLTLADAGAACSVDARSGRGRTTVAAWPVTAIKAQLSAVYLFAGLSKINLPYVAGILFAANWRWEGFLPLPVSLRTVEVLFPLATASIAIEIFLAIALWRPRLRPGAFLVGSLLHAGILVTMATPVQLSIFAALCLACYLLFLDARPGSRAVVWDDSCSFCRTSIRIFSRLDWLRVHSFVSSSDDEALCRLGVTRGAADQAMQLVEAGHRVSGAVAVRRILEALPATFLVAPVLRVWPLRPLADRAYRRIAIRRSCILPLPAGAMHDASRIRRVFEQDAAERTP